MRPPVWAPWLLWVGMLVGAAVAGASLLQSSEAAVGEKALPSDVVAVVDGRPILRDDYERALRAVRADIDGPLEPRDRRRLLDRLIDEELLVQRGIDLGLAARDRRVRADLSAAVIALVSARAEDDVEDASDQELRAFYREHAEWFRTPARIEIEHLFFRASAGQEGDREARRRAEVARSRFARGVSLESLRAEADPYDVPLPAGAVPLGKLRDYLGPTVARGLSSARARQVQGPLRSGAGYHVVRVVSRLDGEVPPYERIEAFVRAEHRRRAGEEALRAWLEARRAEARIEVAEGVL